MYQRWIDIKKQINALEEEKLRVESELYTAHGPGTSTQGEYKIKITPRETVKVDQELADVVQVGFRKKYELDKRAYDKLGLKDQNAVNNCITITPAKPTFSVEKL